MQADREDDWSCHFHKLVVLSLQVYNIAVLLKLLTILVLTLFFVVVAAVVCLFVVVVVFADIGTF